VKPYVKTNKNDGNDAEGICEAVSRPEMRFVPIKSVEQQDEQCLHRVRERLVHDRTALVNQTLGLLREYGVFIPAGIGAIRREIATVLEDAENELTALTREIIADQYERLYELDRWIVDCEGRIDAVFRENENCQRMAQVEGVGPLVATAPPGWAWGTPPALERPANPPARHQQAREHVPAHVIDPRRALRGLPVRDQDRCPQPPAPGGEGPPRYQLRECGAGEQERAHPVGLACAWR
jgi:hypothetical protein